MAATTRTVRVRFDGTAAGLIAAAKAGGQAVGDFRDQAGRGVNRLTSTFGRMGSSIADSGEQLFKLTSRGGPVGGLVALGAASEFLRMNMGALVPAATGVLGVVGAVAVGAGTAKLALSGMGDVMAAIAAGDSEAFEESLKRLTPSAQDAARSMWDLRVPLDGLRKTVQERFFAQFADDIKPTVERYLPMLDAGLGRVSTALGKGVAGFMAWARESSTVERVQKIIDNTADAFERVDFTGYLDGLLTLTGEGSEGMGGLADKVTEWGEEFDRWATRVSTDGSLERWTEQGKDALEGLKDTATTVYEELTGTGGISGWLNDRLADMEGYGERVNNALTGGEGGVVGKGFLEQVAALPDRTAEWLKGLPGRAGDAISGLPDTLGGWARSAWGYFGGATSSGIAGSINLTGTTPSRSGVSLSSLGGVLSGAARSAWGAFSGATSGGIGSAIGLTAGAPGRSAGALGPLAGLLAGRAVGAWSSFRGAAGAGIGAAIGQVRGLPGMAAGALGGIGGVLTGAGRSLISGFIGGIRSMFGSVRSALGSLTNSLTSWKGPPERDQVLLYGAGKLVMGGFRQGLVDGAPDVKAFLQQFTRQMAGAGVAVARSVQAPDPRSDTFESNAFWSRRRLDTSKRLVQAEDGSWSYADQADRAAYLQALGATPQERAARRNAEDLAEYQRMVAAAQAVSAGPQMNAAGLNGVAPTNHITVILDGQPIRAVVHEEMSAAERDTTRRVLTGARVGY